MEEIDPTNTSYFGRIYLRSKDRKSWTLLNSAYFSKLDLRIYSEDRVRLHPGFSNLVGKKFSLGYKIQNPDLLNKTEDSYSGKLDILTKLGENPSPDLEHLPEAFEIEFKLCQELNFVSNEKALALLKETIACAFWTFCTPGKNILEQRFLHTAFPMLYMDDAHEGYGKELISENFDEDKFNLSYKTFAKIASTMMSSSFSGGAMEALEALYHDTTADLNMSMSQAMELLGIVKKMQGAAMSLKDAAIETAKRHGISHEPYFKVLTSAALAGSVEVCAEWKEKDHPKMIPTLTKIRSDSVFGYVAVESIALQHGIQLSERIRENPLFQIYISFFKTSFLKANDLLSYAKECREEGKNCNENEVYLLHVGKGLPLKEALKKVEEDANEGVEQMSRVEQLLLQIYSKDSEDDVNEEHGNLSRYFQTVRQVFTGCLQWYAFNNRYHSSMVYDCFIDEEN